MTNTIFVAFFFLNKFCYLGSCVTLAFYSLSLREYFLICDFFSSLRAVQNLVPAYTLRLLSTKKKTFFFFCFIPDVRSN